MACNITIFNLVKTNAQTIKNDQQALSIKVILKEHLA